MMRALTVSVIWQGTALAYLAGHAGSTAMLVIALVLAAVATAHALGLEDSQ